MEKSAVNTTCCCSQVTDNPLRVWKMLEVSPASDSPSADVDVEVLSTAQQHIKMLVEDREELIKVCPGTR